LGRDDMTSRNGLKHALQSLFSRRQEVATAKTTPLAEYVAGNRGFQSMYDVCQADPGLIETLKAALPSAHVVVVSEYWCGDSRRLVPRLARVLECLPDWTAEVHSWNSTTRDKPWQVRAIPTVIVLQDGHEVGRVVERPQSGALEEDLLKIATGQSLRGY
jgi:hypothetical protein